MGYAALFIRKSLTTVDDELSLVNVAIIFCEFQYHKFHICQDSFKLVHLQTLQLVTSHQLPQQLPQQQPVLEGTGSGITRT